MTTPAKVTVTRRCPNEGEQCFCTGVCIQPVSEREAIEALEGELKRRKMEQEAWKRIRDRVQNRIQELSP